MNEREKEYLDNSILKPYLIHIEFELENVLNKVLKDIQLRTIYQKEGFNITILENRIRESIFTIRTLENLFKIK